jgi:hypothetical protein
LIAILFGSNLIGSNLSYLITSDLIWSILKGMYVGLDCVDRVWQDDGGRFVLNIRGSKYYLGRSAPTPPKPQHDSRASAQSTKRQAPDTKSNPPPSPQPTNNPSSQELEFEEGEVVTGKGKRRCTRTQQPPIKVFHTKQVIGIPKGAAPQNSKPAELGAARMKVKGQQVIDIGPSQDGSRQTVLKPTCAAVYSQQHQFRSAKSARH